MSRVKKLMYRRARRRARTVRENHQVQSTPNIFWFTILLTATFLINLNNTVYLSEIFKSQTTGKSTERILGFEMHVKRADHTRKMFFLIGQTVGCLLMNLTIKEICSLQWFMSCHLMLTIISIVTYITKSQFVLLNFLQGSSSILIEFLIRSISWEKISSDKQLLFNAMMMTVAKLGKIYLKDIRNMGTTVYLHNLSINVICSSIIVAVIIIFKPNPQQNRNSPWQAGELATSRPHEDKFRVVISIAITYFGTTIVRKILKYNYFANSLKYYHVKGFDMINAGEIFLIIAISYIFSSDYLIIALFASQLITIPCYMILKAMVLNTVMSVGMSYILGKLICLVTFQMYRRKLTQIYSIQKRKHIYILILLVQSSAEAMWKSLDDVHPFIITVIISASTGFYLIYHTK